jgi:hypothetical protein
VNERLKEIPLGDATKLAKQEFESRQKYETIKGKVLHNMGFSVDVLDTDNY